MTRGSTTISLWYSTVQIKQVRVLIYGFSQSPTTHNFSTTSLTNPPLKTTPKPQNNNTHLDLSSINLSGIAQSLISKCSHLLDKKSKSEIQLSNPSLKDLLVEVSNVVPQFTRKFRRALELKPEDVLELLLAFQFEVGNFGVESRKVESLWGIFKWVGEKEGFEHLLRSYEVMISMLIQVGMTREVELLLPSMESKGILLANPEIFNTLVEFYVVEGNLEQAIFMYDIMRVRNLALSLSCYRAFLDCLVQSKRIQLVFRVCMDMVEMGFGLSDEEKVTFENVTRLLCRHGKVQEARNLVKRFVAFGFHPSKEVLYEITEEYCEKKDFEDLLRLFIEIGRAPDVLAGNKIIHSLCSHFGSDRAGSFMEELEEIGFKPDEITFGILINWSCHEGKLRNAFLYLSELLSKGLKPDLHSYNALISGLLKECFYKHAREILDEMVERGKIPNLSTFKILLAGFCKARQFDEAKKIVHEMANRGLVKLSPLDDPLYKGFTFLGFDPFAVRLKRDNHNGFSRTEFFDVLGNGMYLDTDLDEYEKRINEILEKSMIPDFSSIIIEEFSKGDWKTALILADEMVRWGQKPSSICFSALMKSSHCASKSQNSFTNLWLKNPHLVAHLDEDSLNLLVQTYSKKRLTQNGKIIFHDMLEMHIKVESETYNALIKSLCKTGKLTDLLMCWEIARKDKWVPRLQDSKSLIEYLCKNGKLDEVFLLLERMMVCYPHIRLDIGRIFIEKLCVTGYATIAHILLVEFLSHGFVMDQMAYSNLILGLCKENNISLAFTILDDMLAMNLAPCLDASILVIPLLCKTGRYEKAITLKEIVITENLYSSLTVYSALIKGFCVTRKVLEASTLFGELLSTGRLPCAEIYNHLVQGHCLVGNSQKVLELLSIMIKKDLTLSVANYRDLVRLMCKNGKVFQAMNLKEFMLGRDKSHSCIIYNILIFHLFSSGNSLLVDKILDGLQEKQLVLDVSTYSFLIYGFSQCKDVSKSVHYLSAMISQEIRPNNRSLRMVINSLCDIGEIGKALELSREMELRKWIHGSTIQTAIVEALLFCGKIKEAETFVERMVEKSLVPNYINYDILIKQFCRYGKIRKAVDLLDIMLKKGNIPSSRSYDSIIQSCCISNSLNKAMDFHTEMLDRGLKPSIETRGILIRSVCENGQAVEAERILTSMVRICEIPTREMYCCVINRYRFENNLYKASELMQVMQQRGYEPDFDTQWSVISNLSNSAKKENIKNRGFLSRLLSESGFSWENDSKAKKIQ